MRPSQIKETEAERVARWKAKNPDKVRGQNKRKRLRKAAEKRAADPTGELAYGPIEGVDAPYPDSSEMPPAPPPPKPTGIEEPPDFIEEVKRENKRARLEALRAEVAMIQPKRIL